MGKTVMMMVLALSLLVSGFVPRGVEAKDLNKQEVFSVTQACLDYIEGFFDSDRERIERAVHEDLVKREAKENSFETTTRKVLIKRALSKKRIKPQMKVHVYDINKNIASACIESQYVDYIQLVKIDGAWKVVNVLWNHR